MLRRSLGRRIDPETDKAYHLDTNRPPYDLICKERLIAPTDASNPSEALALQLASHDLSVAPLLQLLRPFGTVKVVDSSALSTQGVFAQCVHLISDFLEAKAAAAAETAETAAAAAAEMVVAPSSADAADTETEGMEGGEAAAAGESEAGEGGEVPSLAPLVAQSSKVISTMLPSLGGLLASLWSTMEDQYTTGTKQVFRALRQERLLTASWLKQQRATFTDYLTRPDAERPAICSAFLAAFNGIPLELRASASDELRARCEELRWALWASEEVREAAGVARLESIVSNGWLASRVKALERCYAMLLQLELVRFTTALHVLMDYAAAMQGSGVLPEGLLPPLAESASSPDAPDAGSGKGGGKGAKAEASGAPPVRPLAPAVCTAPAFAPNNDEHADAPAAPAATPSKKGGKGGAAAAAKDESPGASPDSMSPLEQCLALALEFVTPWQQARFPVAVNEPSATSGADSNNDCEPPPPPASMHHAIWSEAALCEARLKRCATKGAEAVAKLKATVSHAHEEMGQWVCTRTEEELLAGESLVSIAEEACDSGLPLPDDWQLEGTSLTRGPLMLVAPPLPPPVPKVLPQHHTNFNAHQSSLLTKGLAAAAAALGFNDDAAAHLNPLSTLQDRPLSPPTGGSTGAGTTNTGGFVSCDALVDLLLRLAASDGDLPLEWCGSPARDKFAELIAALDPEDSGLVAVENVFRFFEVA